MDVTLDANGTGFGFCSFFMACVIFGSNKLCFSLFLILKTSCLYCRIKAKQKPTKGFDRTNLSKWFNSNFNAFGLVFPSFILEFLFDIFIFKLNVEIAVFCDSDQHRLFYLKILFYFYLI